MSFDAASEEPPVVSDVATGAKLAKMLDGFVPFDEYMRNETVARQRKDAEKVAAMKAEMVRLQGLLQVNAREQMRANVELQQHCDVELENARTNFASLLDHQVVRVHERLDVLEKRTDDLEALFASEKERILKEIEDRSAELSKMLDAFQAAFEQERLQRLHREEGIAAQMSQHEKHVDAKFVEENEARTTVIDKIKKELNAMIASRAHADRQLKQTCLQHLKQIQEALDVEVQQRESSDDAIIKNLNAYTNKLQSSLSIINNPNA